jgi:ADP-heptose:LPS heptosyltransferase
MDSMSTDKSCLVIKNDGIGDLILASGLIRSLGELFDGNVDLVTCGDNREIAEGLAPLRNRYYVSRDGIGFWNLTAKMGFLIAQIPDEDKAVVQEISSQSYETIICLRRFIRQSTLVLMRKFTGTKKYCAWEFPTNASLNMAKKVTRGWEHHVGSVDVLSELNYNKTFLEKALNTTLASEPCLSFCKKQENSPATRKLALGLGGGSTNWPLENWVELARLLAASGWKLTLLGGENVAGVAQQVVDGVPGADNQVGQLNWRQTSELLSDCEGYIGNDTGLSHFAGLIVRKCLVILGGGTFRRFFPWPGTKSPYIIYHGLDCFDCDWDCKFKERLCLSLVRPKNVFDFYNDVIKGDARIESDLNTFNAKYQISWRRKPGSGEIYVRVK